MPGKLRTLISMIILLAGLFMVVPGTAASRCMLAELFTSTA